ncbi:MAG: sulfatase-like hydrolase/transferase [Bacteroidales bacterium]|nr:sulfatase-like hydrolase/transferase [Bacteroidales bacterium]
MNKLKVKDWFSFFAPRFLLLTLILGVLVRIALILHPVTVIDWGWKDWLAIFGLGFLNDIAFTAIALVPAFVAYTFMTDDKYRKPWGYILWGAFLLFTLYIVFFNDITDEYGGPLPPIINGVLVFLLLCATLKLFIPSIRKGWRTAAIYIVMMLYACAAVTIAFSEVVFWEEFGVRFNFIAVDYLVYTNEVIGNIVESYPIVWMVLAMLVVAGGICYLMTLRRDIRESGISGWPQWAISLGILAAVAFGGGAWLHWGYRNFQRENLYATQLQENGCWDFLEAFMSNELNYAKFYEMLPQEEAVALQQELCGQNADGVRVVRDALPPVKKNIVLITVESLSAEFLTRYGPGYGITPNLDTLLEKSLVFDNLFATGNRTVRGLEAVTLCIPPSSGESLVKRPDCSGLFSTGQVLRDNGYSTSYIYGGDSYFDNMGTFYGACGYEIVDKKTYDKDAIVMANIWGTSDEDSYREALKRFDASYEAGELFFAQIMTISNHRPYTYPEGRIEYEGNPMSRHAAVKYTDWAIGDFLRQASSKPWFSETVFVIMADHCASSAGKTSLPLDCYHIPALIYAPGFIEPQYIGKICSQIDIMPTLFSLLHLSYDAPFYGQDILSDDFKERAFMATYQDLGYFTDNILTVLSPVRRVQQFAAIRHDEWWFNEEPLAETAEKQLREAQAFYQVANLAHAR